MALRKHKSRVLRWLVGIISLFILVGTGAPAEASNGAYGDGDYGECTYGTCSITLTSSGSVSASVAPSSGTKCTVQSDSVGVLTDSSTGYTLTFSDSDTSNTLTSGSYTIPAISGSQASPGTLAANKWGYRVDSVGGFGSGPTSAGSNVAVPSLTFAPVPLSSGTADTLATSTSSADPTVTTNVWYGVCANQSTTAATYSDSVTYTAVVN